MPTTTLITAVNTLLASGAGGVKGAAATARSARAVIQTKKARATHEMLLLNENRGCRTSAMRCGMAPGPFG